MQGAGLFAISHDKSGRNIPRSPCTEGWSFCEEFLLSDRGHVPAPIQPAPVLKGIADRGYYVWRGWSGPTNLVEELDRIIHSAVLRIAQQSIDVEKLSASPRQVSCAQEVLDQMIEGLHQLRLRRARFA
jgi:hypothetical protein